MIARLDDLVADRALVFGPAHRVLRAERPDEVEPLVREVEAATAAGAWAVGYLGYEAVAGLVPDAPVHPGALVGPPLAWFALTDPPVPEPALASIAAGEWQCTPWRLDWDEPTHAERVAAVRDAIAAGDTYQANLTTTARADITGDLLAFYADLTRRQRGAHHAYLDLGEHVVASASPERFLRWAGDALLSSPMKGTARRRPERTADLAARDALLASTKDRAENLMIVDMVRNDLSQIAEPGTVTVSDLFRAERYESVWQLTSDVTGRVRPGTTLLDVLRALFPCASITGAPRGSTMQLLTEIEDGPRGIYTGAIGFVAPPDEPMRAAFNVAIRTAVVERASGAATFGVGGGITWSSEAAGEYAELLAKTSLLSQPAPAFALFETLGRRIDPTTGRPVLVDLDAHLDRLAGSAEHVGFGFDRDALRRRIHAETEHLDEARVRVELARDGGVSVQTAPLPPSDRGPVRLALDPDPVDPDSRWLHHKTTRREVYDVRRARHPDADDVVLVNDRGQVTETTIASLAVRLDGRWWTPPTSDGLLPGVRRARLIAEGVLAERSITVAELGDAEAVAVVSSLRGWREAVLIDPPARPAPGDSVAP